MTSYNSIHAFQFLNLVKEGKKSFHDVHDFNEFLNLNLNIKNNDIHYHATRQTPIMLIIRDNLELYKIPPDKIVQIFHKSDMNKKDDFGWSNFHYIIFFNNELKLNNQQISELLKKSDLTYSTAEERFLLHFIMAYNKIENLGFSEEQLLHLYDKTLQLLDNKKMVEEKKKFIHNIYTNFPKFKILYEKKLLNNHAQKNHSIKLRL